MQISEIINAIENDEINQEVVDALDGQVNTIVEHGEYAGNSLAYVLVKNNHLEILAADEYKLALQISYETMSSTLISTDADDESAPGTPLSNDDENDRYFPRKTLAHWLLITEQGSDILNLNNSALAISTMEDIRNFYASELLKLQHKSIQNTRRADAETDHSLTASEMITIKQDFVADFWDGLVSTFAGRSLLRFNNYELCNYLHPMNTDSFIDKLIFDRDDDVCKFLVENNSYILSFLHADHWFYKGFKQPLYDLLDLKFSWRYWQNSKIDSQEWANAVLEAKGEREAECVHDGMVDRCDDVYIFDQCSPYELSKLVCDAAENSALLYAFFINEIDCANIKSSDEESSLDNSTQAELESDLRQIQHASLKRSLLHLLKHHFPQDRTFIDVICHKFPLYLVDELEKHPNTLSLSSLLELTELLVINLSAQNVASVDQLLNYLSARLGTSDDQYHEKLASIAAQFYYNPLTKSHQNGLISINLTFNQDPVDVTNEPILTGFTIARLAETMLSRVNAEQEAAEQSSFVAAHTAKRARYNQ